MRLNRHLSLGQSWYRIGADWIYSLACDGGWTGVARVDAAVCAIDQAKVITFSRHHPHTVGREPVLIAPSVESILSNMN